MFIFFLVKIENLDGILLLYRVHPAEWYKVLYRSDLKW